MGSKKTTQTQSSTVTPTNPQWVTQGAQGLAGNVENLLGRDPQSFFAGASDLQQQGFDLFGGLGAKGADWINQAAGLAGGQGGYDPAQMQAAQTGPASHAQAQTAFGGIGNYVNPHETTVINNTMGDLDRARQLTHNQNGQGAILAGGYGGSRQGVLDANADESFLRSVGNVAGNLRHQGFTTAIGAADADASRGTQTSMFNAGQDNTLAALNAQMEQQANAANQGATNEASQFGGAQQQQQAALLAQLGGMGLGGLMDAGGVQQGIEQGQASAPLTVQQLLSGSYGSLPLGLFNGQSSTGTGTVKQNSGVLGGLGSLAMGIGGLGSGFNGFGLFGGK